MFYKIDYFGRKGRFAIWWRVAHDVKGAKRHLRRASIKVGVADVLGTPVPMALRMQGVIMFGLVRSYDIQVTEHSERVHHFFKQVSQWAASGRPAVILSTASSSCVMVGIVAPSS